MDLIARAKRRGYKEGTIINYGFGGDNETLGSGNFEIDRHGRLIKWEKPKDILVGNDHNLYDVIYDENGWTKIVKK